MSIRFKFRSELNFETVDIQNRDSISVGEIRARILKGKNAQPKQQGFDLLFYDEDTDLEYEGDDSQIRRGSSVIVKRIPASTAPSAMPPSEPVKEAENVPTDIFEDISLDLRFVLESDLPQFDIEIGTNQFIGNEKEDAPGSRLECEIDSRGVGQLIPKGSYQAGNQKNTLLEEARVDELMKLNKLCTSNPLAVQSSNLPSDLKCILCNTFFKEAVMIPCCQHSFCEKCIRLALIETRSCPRCFSSRCTVADLLPNVSLRQAIKHFLGSQILDTDVYNGMDKYVPDGESFIRAKDAPCAAAQRELEWPQSKFTPAEDFQGENEPLIVPQSNIHHEGGDRNRFALDGQKKGVRHCYVCGSPDHLMRECPVSNPNPIFQPGNEAYHGGMSDYGQTYWNSSSLPPFRPYANMYGNSAAGMMPFNASYPVSPFAAPPYIPSMSGGMVGPGGNMGPSCYPEYFGLQHCDNSRKHSSETLGRERLSENEDGSPEHHQHDYPEKLQDTNLQKHRGPSSNHSGDSLIHRSGKKTRHDKRIDSDIRCDERHEKSSHLTAGGDKRPCAERPTRSPQDKPRSSDQHSEGRHRHHPRESAKYNDRRDHDSDTSLGNHATRKDGKKRLDSDFRDSHKRHHSNSESSFRLVSPVEGKRGYGESDIGRGARHARDGSKHSRDKRHDCDRWKMDAEGRDEYRHHKHRHHKQKRVY